MATVTVPLAPPEGSKCRGRIDYDGGSLKDARGAFKMAVRMPPSKRSWFYAVHLLKVGPTEAAIRKNAVITAGRGLAVINFTPLTNYKTGKRITSTPRRKFDEWASKAVRRAAKAPKH